MLGWEVIPRIGAGSFSISPHGVGIALGYFAGTIFTARRARARGYDEDHVWNVAAVAVIGAIAGARIAYVVGHASEFESPAEWLQIWKGGISLVGALLGAFLAGYLYTRKSKIDFFQLGDLSMAGLAIGIAVGRIGDLVIGDHLGKATSGWWGWQYKGGELISPPPCIYPTPDGCIQPGMVVHQTALYDSLWSLAIFGILIFLDKKPRKQGFFVLGWALLYSLGRIFTDFTRVDKRWFGLGLTGSQLTALAVLLLCGFLLARHRGAPGRPAVDMAGMAPSKAGFRQPRDAGTIPADPGTEGPGLVDSMETEVTPVLKPPGRPGAGKTLEKLAPEPPGKPESEPGEMTGEAGPMEPKPEEHAPGAPGGTAEVPPGQDSPDAARPDELHQSKASVEPLPDQMKGPDAGQRALEEEMELFARSSATAPEDVAASDEAAAGQKTTGEDAAGEDAAGEDATGKDAAGEDARSNEKGDAG